jgi:hypothetical protein
MGLHLTAVPLRSIAAGELYRQDRHRENNAITTLDADTVSTIDTNNYMGSVPF